MGWANCGEDSRGRPIGYAHEAKCDHPGCKVKIDRGLSYACGGMHGETEHGCEKYFCSEHLPYVVEENDMLCHVCTECGNELINSDEWEDDDGILSRI